LKFVFKHYKNEYFVNGAILNNLNIMLQKQEFSAEFKAKLCEKLHQK